MKSHQHSPTKTTSVSPPSFSPLTQSSPLSFLRTLDSPTEASTQTSQARNTIPIHLAVPENIQTKLQIDEPGDFSEQEADEVAEQVIQPLNSENVTPPQIQTKIAPAIHKKESDTLSSDTTNVPAIVDEVVHNEAGQSLNASTRAFMEPRLGHDFSKVRIHTDKRADESAHAISALAYTVGHDIVFATGQYTPNTMSGKRLLAHELTHVVQQSRSTDMRGGYNSPSNTHSGSSIRARGQMVQRQAIPGAGRTPGVGEGIDLVFIAKGDEDDVFINGMARYVATVLQGEYIVISSLDDLFMRTLGRLSKNGQKVRRIRLIAHGGRYGKVSIGPKSVAASWVSPKAVAEYASREDVKAIVRNVMTPNAEVDFWGCNLGEKSLSKVGKAWAGLFQSTFKAPRGTFESSVGTFPAAGKKEGKRAKGREDMIQNTSEVDALDKKTQERFEQFLWDAYSALSQNQDIPMLDNPSDVIPYMRDLFNRAHGDIRAISLIVGGQKYRPIDKEWNSDRLWATYVPVKLEHVINGQTVQTPLPEAGAKPGGPSTQKVQTTPTTTSPTRIPSTETPSQITPSTTSSPESTSPVFKDENVRFLYAVGQTLRNVADTTDSKDMEKRNLLSHMGWSLTLALPLATHEGTITAETIANLAGLWATTLNLFVTGDTQTTTTALRGLISRLSIQDLKSIESSSAKLISVMPVSQPVVASQKDVNAQEANVAEGGNVDDISQKLDSAAKTLEEASNKFQAKRPKLDETMRTAYRKGDANTLATIADYTGTMLDVTLSFRQLAVSFEEWLTQLRKDMKLQYAPDIPQQSERIAKYINWANNINKLLALINTAYTFTHLRTPDELGTLANNIKSISSTNSALITLLSFKNFALPAHVALYAELLVRLTNRVVDEVDTLVDAHIHELNITLLQIDPTDTSGIAKSPNYPGKDEWQRTDIIMFMSYVMHAENVEDIPPVPRNVEDYLLDNRKLIQRGTKDPVETEKDVQQVQANMPVTGYIWHDLDSTRIKSWLYKHRDAIWAMFYGNLPVPTTP